MSFLNPWGIWTKLNPWNYNIIKNNASKLGGAIKRQKDYWHIGEELSIIEDNLEKMDPHGPDKENLSNIAKTIKDAIKDGVITPEENAKITEEAEALLKRDGELSQRAATVATEVGIIDNNFRKVRSYGITAALLAAIGAGGWVYQIYTSNRDVRAIANDADNKIVGEIVKGLGEKIGSLENEVRNLASKSPADAGKKPETDSVKKTPVKKVEMPIVTSEFYTVRNEGDDQYIVLTRYGTRQKVKVEDARAAVDLITKIEKNDPALKEEGRDYNFEEFKSLVEKLEQLGKGTITNRALKIASTSKSLSSLKELAEKGPTYNPELTLRINEYIQKNIELGKALDNSSRIPETEEKQKDLLWKMAEKNGELSSIETYDLEKAVKEHNSTIKLLEKISGQDYSKLNIKTAPEKAPEKKEEPKMPEKSEKAPVEEYAVRLMPADEEAITPPVFVSNEPEPPAADPAPEPAKEPEAPKEPPKEVPKEPPKEEPKVEAKPYVASYRLEIAEGLGGMARAYLTALNEARTQHNKAFGSKKYIATTPSGEVATIASMIDQNKDGKVEASELEEACNQLEKDMDAVKKFTKDREYEGKDHSRLKIEAKFGGEDYVEAKIEIPSIAQGSPEAARLDAVRELMKKTGNEHKFVNLCEQYNTTLAKDGKFNLADFEKYAQEKYGDKK